MKKEITTTINDVGQRLDVFCVGHANQYSRSAIQKAIKAGEITVNGKTQKQKYFIQEKDLVRIKLHKNKEQQLEENKVSLPIIFENEHLVVVDKPAGLVVHPGKGNESQTVASWFLDRYPQLKNIGEDVSRPGIVHRLDKDTSGVLVLAKSDKSYRSLKEQFEKRRIAKEYLALVFGTPGGKDGRIKQPLLRSKHNPMRRTVDVLGKEAITEWKIEKKFGASKYTLLRIQPYTGRTHQIRVHLHFLGYPIVGDALYTFKRQRPPQGVHRQLLHAENIRLRLLDGTKKKFTAPLAKDFQEIIDNLDNTN